MLAAVDLFNPDWWYSLLPLKNRALLENTLFLIPLFPLVGFLLNGLFGSRMEKKVSGWIAVLAALASFIWAFFSVMALHVPNPTPEARNMLHMIYGTWLNNSDVNFTFGLMLDQISSVMILIVTGIGALIHIYSLG